MTLSSALDLFARIRRFRMRPAASFCHCHFYGNDTTVGSRLGWAWLTPVIRQAFRDAFFVMLLFTPC